MKDGDELSTIEEVCQKLKVHKSWIYGRIHTGTLPFPYAKVGTYLRFRRDEVEAYI